MMIFLELIGVILVIIFLFFLLNFFLKAFMKTIIVIIAIFVMILVFSLFLTYNDLKSLNYEDTVVFFSSMNKDDEELILGFYFEEGDLIKIHSIEILDKNLEEGIKSNKYLKSFLDDKIAVVVISDNALLRFDNTLEDDLNNIIKEDDVNEFYNVFKEYISNSNFFEITFAYFKNELKKEPRFFFTRFKIIEKTLLWFTGLFN